MSLQGVLSLHLSLARSGGLRASFTSYALRKVQPQQRLSRAELTVRALHGGVVLLAWGTLCPGTCLGCRLLPGTRLCSGCHCSWR